MASSSNNDGPTQGKKLQDFYGSETATMYAGMMEEEMVKYKDDFSLLFKAMQTSTPKTDSTKKPATMQVLDTCCGSGHMLQYINDNLKNCELKLAGRDLSPDMITVAKTIVPQATSLTVGNMLDVKSDSDEQYQLVLNNFAMHHATAEQAKIAIQEYARILASNGCLYFSAWEGSGKIDYGGMDMEANFHSEKDMKAWVTETAGLKILLCRSFLEAEMGDMNSVYIVAQKPG